MGRNRNRANQSRKSIPNQAKGNQQQAESEDHAHQAMETREPKSQQLNADDIRNQSRDLKGSSNKPSIDQDMLKWTAIVGRWTRIVGIATGVTAFIALIGIAATVWVGLKSDETARAAQRPWMRFDEQTAIVAPLVFERAFEKNGDRFTLHTSAKTKIRIHLRNTGNSPAIKVVTRVEFIADDIKNESQQQICESIKNEPQPGHDEGFTSFPGIEPIQQEIPLSASYPPGVGPAIPHFFTIVGCVTYRFSFGDDAPHQTGIVFNLVSTKIGPRDHVVPNNNDDLTAIDNLFIDPKTGPIVPGDLRLAVSHVGSFAN